MEVEVVSKPLALGRRLANGHQCRCSRRKEPTPAGGGVEVGHPARRRCLPRRLANGHLILWENAWRVWLARRLANGHRAVPGLWRVLTIREGEDSGQLHRLAYGLPGALKVQISSLPPVQDVQDVQLARFGCRLARVARVAQGRLCVFHFRASRYVKVTCPPPGGLEGVLARVPSVSIVASRARASAAGVAIRRRATSVAVMPF